MENNVIEEVMEVTNVDSVDDVKSGGGLALVGTGLVFIAGAAAHKYVLAPLAKRFRSWKTNRKTEKQSDEVIDVECNCDDVETEE